MTPPTKEEIIKAIILEVGSLEKEQIIRIYHEIYGEGDFDPADLDWEDTPSWEDKEFEENCPEGYDYY
tara:strand:+ start:281 stop:484 length:204 start_codon:yes stop_codon:yes gene_type:complete